MGERLAGRRVLVTEADDFMGPAVLELFKEEGAQVIADRTDLRQPGRCEALTKETGQFDVLVANLSIPKTRALAQETTDEDWSAVFERFWPATVGPSALADGGGASSAAQSSKMSIEHAVARGQ